MMFDLLNACKNIWLANGVVLGALVLLAQIVGLLACLLKPFVKK